MSAAGTSCPCGISRPSSPTSVASMSPPTSRAAMSFFGRLPSWRTRSRRLITDGIAERFDLRVPVVTRSAAELERVVAGNPYLGIEPDFTKLHVVFLADRPTAAASSALDPDRSPRDSFEIQGGEIYLHLPNGAASYQAQQRLFRCQARHHEHGAQLEDGAQAQRARWGACHVAINRSAVILSTATPPGGAYSRNDGGIQFLSF